jgi:hypothetical protein
MHAGAIYWEGSRLLPSQTLPNGTLPSTVVRDPKCLLRAVPACAYASAAAAAAGAPPASTRRTILFIRSFIRG